MKKKDTNLYYDYLGDKLKPFVEAEFNRKNRFIITYPKELGLDEWVTYSSTPIELQLPNETMLSGIHDPLAPEVTVYSDLVIEVQDPVSPSSAQKVMKFMKDEWKSKEPRRLVYLYKNLAPTGEVTRTSEVLAFIKSVDFGSLDYDSDELLRIKLTLGVDHVRLV